MAEWEPERDRAFKRSAAEASEECWHEARRLLRSSTNNAVADVTNSSAPIIGDIGTKLW